MSNVATPKAQAAAKANLTQQSVMTPKANARAASTELCLEVEKEKRRAVIEALLASAPRQGDRTPGTKAG